MQDDQLRFTRRQGLRAGMGAAVAGFWSSWLQRAAAAGSPAGSAKSVIMVFNCGAPSHLDLWDMLPVG